MHLEKTPLGYEIRTPSVTIFLGGSQAQLAQLTTAYPEFDFVRVKQTHSDLVIRTIDPKNDLKIEADAHYSAQKNIALCVVTADCVPLFFYDNQTGLIAGVHAGWRGVASRIIPKTIAELVGFGAKPQNIDVVIGPHIQKRNFEVGINVRDQILASLGPLSEEDRTLFYNPTTDEKGHLDLNLVVQTQLQQSGIQMDRLFCMYLDTYSSPDFHSHRRDKELAGRQVSFICRTR